MVLKIKKIIKAKIYQLFLNYIFLFLISKMTFFFKKKKKNRLKLISDIFVFMVKYSETTHIIKYIFKKKNNKKSVN